MRQIHPGKAYGRIGHLPGSRRDPGDTDSAARTGRLCTAGPLPPGARLYVLEKLDGSCVAAWRQGGAVLAIGRQGDLAALSPNPGRQLWAEWVARNQAALLGALEDGERLVGEWLTLAHAVQYRLPHGPFVAFDLMHGPVHLPRATLEARLSGTDIPVVGCVATAPIPPREALERLGAGFHGAGSYGGDDAPEGLVYRLEQGAGETFRVALSKFVRDDHRPGRLLPENTGAAPIWNVWPTDRTASGKDPVRPPDHGSFEAHLTVDSGADRAAFAAACLRRGLRCVDIELARGAHASQPMTASTHRGRLEDVLTGLRQLAQELQDEGFPVTRLKVEALGDHPLMPRTDADAALEPADRYFEFHLKLLLADTADTGPLTALAVQHGAHLSRNARKTLDHGEHRFLTLRAANCGRGTAEARFRALVLAVQDAGYLPVARTQEYTVYDSRAALDDGWLPASPPPP